MNIEVKNKLGHVISVMFNTKEEVMDIFGTLTPSYKEVSEWLLNN